MNKKSYSRKNVLLTLFLVATLFCSTLLTQTVYAASYSFISGGQSTAYQKERSGSETTYYFSRSEFDNLQDDLQYIIDDIDETISDVEDQISTANRVIGAAGIAVSISSKGWGAIFYGRFQAYVWELEDSIDELEDIQNTYQRYINKLDSYRDYGMHAELTVESCSFGPTELCRRPFSTSYYPVSLVCTR